MFIIPKLNTVFCPTYPTTCITRVSRLTVYYFVLILHRACISSNPQAGNLFLEEQGIKYDTAWHLWQNELALFLLSILFMILAYIQMRTIKKFK